MAIEFASITIYSRSKGNSAVAVAAYCSASKLYDKRTGEIHNFKNKEHVIYNSIMLPDGSDEKLEDREYLWNEVEKAEKKSNARVSKDIIIALPKELSKDDWIQLSRQYADEHFVSKGVVADLAIHNIEDNPHCHILVTTRRLLGDKFDSHKARDLDGEMRNSGYGNFSTVNSIYAQDWRDLQNKYFDEKHMDIVVDQNYLISQRHHGKVINESNYLKEENALKIEQSKEIALNDPDLAITILSQRNTVLSEKDIESFAFKHSSSKEEFLKVKESIIGNKNILKLGPDDNGRLRYTTKHAIKK